MPLLILLIGALAGLNPAGVGRQLRAVLASGSRKERLRNVKAPSLVIHGTVDPLVHPMGGQDTAASIPGARTSFNAA